MRDPDRIPKILKEVERIWKKNPDLRLGQLIGNVVEGPLAYYVEDEDLIERMERVYK